MSLRADSRAGAARVCVQVHRERYRAQAVRHARAARRRHELLEHASPVLGSGLGKIGQAGDPGIGYFLEFATPMLPPMFSHGALLLRVWFGLCFPSIYTPGGALPSIPFSFSLATIVSVFPLSTKHVLNYFCLVLDQGTA